MVGVPHSCAFLVQAIICPHFLLNYEWEVMWLCLGLVLFDPKTFVEAQSRDSSGGPWEVTRCPAGGQRQSWPRSGLPTLHPACTVIAVRRDPGAVTCLRSPTGASCCRELPGGGVAVVAALDPDCFPGPCPSLTQSKRDCVPWRCRSRPVHSSHLLESEFQMQVVTSEEGVINNHYLELSSLPLWV